MSAVVELKTAPKDLYEIGEIPPLGHVPKNMYRLGHPQRPPWSTADRPSRSKWYPPGASPEHEVLILRDGGGRELQRRVGRARQPLSPLDGHKFPYHIAGSDASGIVWAVGSKVTRWKVGDEIARPLQSGRRRRRGMQRRRSDVFAVAAHLGLRNAGRLVRAIRPRAGSRQLMRTAEAPHLGRSGLLHAHACNLLPHAVRPSRRICLSPATTCWSGARAAAWARSACSFAPSLAPMPSASSPTNPSANSCPARRQGRHQPQGFQMLGPDAHGQHAGI